MQYRKKNVTVVNAEQYLLKKVAPEGVCFCPKHKRAAHIHTAPNTVQLIFPGDFIVRYETGMVIGMNATGFAALFEPITTPTVEQELKEMLLKFSGDAEETSKKLDRLLWHAGEKE